MRLAVTGPQNTGKSTYIQDFIEHFPQYQTPQETYRDLIAAQQLEINQKGTEANQRQIRDFLYNQISTNQKQNIIFDRCVLDNYVYSLALYDEGRASLEFLNETFNLLLKHLEYLDGIIFIPTAVSVKLSADGVRDTDVQYIDKINRLFTKTLFLVAKQVPIELFVITGDREQRLALSSDIFSYMHYRLRLQ